MKSSLRFAWMYLLLFAGCALWVASGCKGSAAAQTYSPVPGGDPRQGRLIIQAYNCGACHIIPGVPRATGLLGPPLNFWARRTYIAGEFPNTPQNLVRWVMVPASMQPENAMPNLGLSEAEARSVAAYLYTLR